MKRLCAAGLAWLLMGQAAPAPDVGTLRWMSGHWEVLTAQARWTEEHWSVERGGVMLGFSRTLSGTRLSEFEFLRIQAGTDGVPVYVAQPGGRPPVAFRLAAHDANSATFENPAHDFPQRIRYVRTGDAMVATISAMDGSNAMSWTYRRQ